MCVNINLEGSQSVAKSVLSAKFPNVVGFPRQCSKLANHELYSCDPGNQGRMGSICYSTSSSGGSEHHAELSYDQLVRRDFL